MSPRVDPNSRLAPRGIEPSARAVAIAFVPEGATPVTAREPGLPIPVLIAASVVLHGLVLAALAGLAPLTTLTRAYDAFVEIDVAPEPSSAPTPTLAPEAPPIIAPAASPAPSLRARPSEPRPTVAAPSPPPAPPPAPTPAPSAAPPSLDEVFGAEPAPSAEVLASTGAGGFAMDLGAQGGVAGGRAGGHGEGLRAGGGSGVVASSGPSEADRRRARREYVRSLEGLLGGRVRYPRAAMREHLEGRAELCLRIGLDGRVLGHRVCRSAGHELLDDAALEAAARLERVPAPPRLAAWTAEDEIHAGVVFVLR